MAVQDALLNLGYDPGSFEGYTHDAGSTKGLIKLDWNVNDKNRVSFVYNFLDASKDKPAHPTAIGFRGPNSQVLQFENSGYQINNKIQSFLLELNSTFLDKISNKFQAGYTHFDDFRKPFSTPAPVITIQDGSGSNYIIAGHEPFSINNVLDQKVIQITNNMNIVSGNHNYTVGVSFEKFQFKNSFNLVNYESFNFGIFPYYGLFSSYPDVQTFLDNTQPGGLVDQYLDATQNAYNTSNTNGAGNDNGWKLSELNVGQFSFYLQDEWNVKDNFKLTYGVRFDKPLYFDTSDLIQKFIDTDNGATRDDTVDYFDPATGNAVKLNSTTLPTDKILISPRVGFNWDINGDNTAQLRGGTGLFTGRLPFVWLGNQVSGADDGFFQVVDPDFKWPQVWRTSLGFDKKLKNGLTLTADLSYTIDMNGAHVQNWGLKAPTGTLVGVDNRSIYLGADYGSNNAYVFTNSDKGRTFNSTIKAQKRFENGFFASLAYNYLDSKDVNSIEAEITGDAFAFNPSLGNVNDDKLAHSKYGDDYRFIGIFSKDWNYGANDKWSTSLSAVIEYARGGRFNYTYGGDINGDGSGVNDLIYIPTSDEIALMTFAAPGQGAAFDTFIKQDDYLSDRRGQYAERYAALSPWRGKWDAKLLQTLKLKNGDSFEFSIDVLNLSNLINSDWGVVQQPTSVQPIGVAVDQITNIPTYSFDGTLTKTFQYDTSLLSRWQVQFGLRYRF